MGFYNRDGWGIGWYQSKNNPIVIKEPKCAYSSKKFALSAAEGESHIFVAHVRISTKGGHTRENCHPFQYNKWLFAHNGTVYDDSSLREKLSESHRTSIAGQTDSEVLFHWLLQNIESSDTVVEGVKSAIKAIKNFTILNFLLSDGSNLYAYRDVSNNPSNSSLYYQLRDPTCST